MTTQLESLIHAASAKLYVAGVIHDRPDWIRASDELNAALVGANYPPDGESVLTRLDATFANGDIPQPVARLVNGGLKQ